MTASLRIGNMRASLLLLPVVFSLQAETLDVAVNRIAKEAVEKFEATGLTRDKIALTVIDLRGAAQASYRGSVPVYPASVVKLFYLAAAHRQMESGNLPDTLELRRALRDMIVDSSNDATGMIVDSLTGTTGGPELSQAELTAWLEKRNWMNRYFAGLGYTGISVNQKTFAEGPYGRERQGRGKQFENNNRLTTEATARLIQSIVTKKAVTPARCGEMMTLLHRDFSAPAADPDDQAHGFSGSALPKGAGYWSKAGWTSTTRHDATYVELPGGARYVAVVFTVDNAKQAGIIPFVAGKLANYFSATDVLLH